MNKLIYGAIGLVIGSIGGYFVARRKFQKELAAKTESLERTYKAMREIDEQKSVEKTEEAVQKAKEETREKVHEEMNSVDVVQLAAEEEQELNAFWETFSEDPACDDSWTEYFKSIEDYLVSTAAGVPPYNITEEMFSDISNHYNKVHLVIDKVSELESARNVDTDEVTYDFHYSIGDIEYNTLDPARKIGGYWYIRNPNEDTDYCVELVTMEDLVH